MQTRRTLLAALMLAGSACAFAAEEYPTKAIQFVVPYPPGGASDLIARILSEKLQGIYGQPVIVQNRPGANGNIALEFVAKAQADGYTILMGNVGPNAINPAVYPPAMLKFDALKSFEAIVQTGNVPMVLVASTDLPVKNVGELLSYAKAQPKPMIFATGGAGSATHLGSALIEQLGKVKFDHVQYKGDAFTLTDIAGGHVKVGMVTLPALTPFLTNPKIRLLGVTTSDRTARLPNVPTLAESGLPKYSSASWGGILAPAGTSPAIIKSLNTRFVEILRQPAVSQRMAELGIDIVANQPAEFRSFLEGEVDKWRGVVRASGITVE